MKKRNGRKKAKATALPTKKLQKTSNNNASALYLKSRLQKFIERVVIFSALVGIIIFADWMREQYASRIPEIHPHDTIDASSFVLPFTIKNQSFYFPMDNVKFTCGVDLFYFMDADRKTDILRDAAFENGIFSIPFSVPYNYYCDASKLIRLQSDGSLMIGDTTGQFLKTKAGVFRPPLKILKMCLWISGEYKILGFPVHFATTMFQWPSEPDQYQWREGPIAFDDDNAKWMPTGSKIQGAWAFRRIMAPDESGKNQLIPSALQCSLIK